MKRTSYRDERETDDEDAEPSASAGGGTANRAKLLAWAIVLAALAGGSHFAWTRVREHVVARDDYRLTARDIAITAPPAWIRADVKTEVLRNSGLAAEPLSILDDELVERVQRAFSLHPWVAKVERISKSHPAHVDVEITYRRPVAMVEVPGGLLPVDVEGVLLPSDDFSPLAARSYPRFSGIESSPLGPTGTKWGDPIVAGGARIAEVLKPVWDDLGVRAIHWAKPPATSELSGPAIYELITAAGNSITWGAAPGYEPTGEPPSPEKLLRLKAYIAAHGSLDQPQGGPVELDLRHSDVTPHTAARSQ
jgi:hypothetical protein